MKCLPSIPVFLAATSAVLGSASAQIAVTEFFPNPRGLLDSDGEFVELFNFSDAAVNLKDWTISDEDLDSEVISEVDLFIAPGGYLVIARNKAALEGAFFGGASQDGIVEMTGLTLANGGDEIILSNPDSAVIWSVAYPDGAANGDAAFLSVDDFSTAVFGTKALPGVNFTEVDPATVTGEDPDGHLGYQNNNVTTDPEATTTVDDDTASPLAGFYTPDGGVDPGPDDFRIISIVPSDEIEGYTITFNSEPGKSYTTEAGPDLNSFAAQAVLLANDTTTSYNVLAIGEKRYFRVREAFVVILD